MEPAAAPHDVRLCEVAGCDRRGGLLGRIPASVLRALEPAAQSSHTRDAWFSSLCAEHSALYAPCAVCGEAFPLEAGSAGDWARHGSGSAANATFRRMTAASCAQHGIAAEGGLFGAPRWCDGCRLKEKRAAAAAAATATAAFACAAEQHCRFKPVTRAGRTSRPKITQNGGKLDKTLRDA
jgi:hypothetical protein